MEIDQALELLPLQRLIFFFFGFGKDNTPFAQEFERRFGRIEKLESIQKSHMLVIWSWLVLPQGYDLGKVIYF